MSAPRTYRVAWLASHPIQYEAPLLRRLSSHPRINLTVLYLSNLGARESLDPGFGVRFAWDIPLLDGYRHKFLDSLDDCKKLSFWRPFTRGITRELRTGFDAVVVHGYAHQAFLRAIAIAKLLGIKVFLRGDSNPRSERLSPTKRLLKRQILGRLFALVDGFLAVGTRNKEYYANYGVQPKKIFHVPFAVDNEFFRTCVAEASKHRERLRRELGLEAGRPVILYVGKLQRYKRPMDLLDAYTRLSPDGASEPVPYLVFVGDGAERVSLEQRSRRLGWPAVKFVGFKNQSELPRYYDLCDVFVLPSERESWGLVVNEVMSCAKPVIVSEVVGAAGDIVQDGVNGFVVPVGDVAALAQALRTITANLELAMAMGRKSAEIIARWGFEQDLDGILSALDAIVARKT
jgi:glycosyltransferase involved in cell wall biosynthesis